MTGRQDFAARSISLGSDDYRSSLHLREEVLLTPFGIALARAQGDDERATHLGLFTSSGECVACLLLIDQGRGTLQMRQVAVKAKLQRSGLGRALLLFSEQWALACGFRTLWANARETALPFYLSLQYQRVGERFDQVGLPHFRVEKTLETRRTFLSPVE